MSFADFKVEQDDETYYLIPELNGVEQEKFTGYPNIPITYFAENAKVTLGGELTLNHLFVGNTSRTATSGRITIE